MFAGCNCVILDLETLQSAEDLTTGWNDKLALGLSIGGYYDYLDGQLHWFDRYTLAETVVGFVARQPMLVSFNGIGFDFALMRALLRHSGDAIICPPDARVRMHTLCDTFKTQCAASYDLLAEVWRADPEQKFTKGLNSLDALCLANGLGQKTGDGATAPRLWQAGRIAEVLSYCQRDIYLTKALLELATQQMGRLQRSVGPIQIRWLRPGPNGMCVEELARV